MSSPIAWIIGLALLAPLAAQAAAYKCTDANGKISFSDMPCPTTATSSQKVMERGAGSNPLTDEEKNAFKNGVMQNCNGPRNVCECFGEILSNSLSYEEIQQAAKNRNNMTTALAEKSQKAMRTCQSSESRR